MSKKQSKPRKPSPIKIFKTVEAEYDFNLKRVISGYREEDDEIWGDVYDIAQATRVYCKWNNRFDINQGGFYLEALFITQKKQWFLYSHASEASFKHICIQQAGINISPLYDFEAFTWLVDENAPVEIFEKYFPEKITAA